MAEGRVAFLAGCAITGSLAFAVAKGWIAVGAPPSSVPGLSDSANGVPLLEAGQLPPAPTVTMLPSPTTTNGLPAAPAVPATKPAEAPAAPTGDSAIAKLEEQIRKQNEQSKETLVLLREEMKQQRADLEKLRDELKGQDKALTSMALDEKLTRMVANHGEPPNPWSNGVLWALGGMVLTVSSIVMAGVISTMARQNRGGGYGMHPHAPQPFHPIRVVPTYLPRARQQDYAARREPGTADFVEYDY
ncbi:MAG TPA: hypothetical protein V6D46_04115 [Coleofasciculaceae cyanobacterium]